MNDSFELDEFLTASNPIDEADLADVGDSLFARQLFERVTGTAYQAGRPIWTRRRWQASVALAAAILSTGAGVAYALVSSPPSNHLTVACYREARIDASAAVVIGSARDPIAACRVATRQEGGGGTLLPAGRLSACVLPSGVVGVFPSPDPGTDTCRQLNLTHAAPAGRTSATKAAPGAGAPNLRPVAGTAVTGLIESISHALTPGCIDAGQARVLIDQALKQLGLGSWTITVRGSFSPDRPCASPGLDEANHEVFLIPIPRPG